MAHPFLSNDFLDVERRLIAEEWLPTADTIVYEGAGGVVGFLALVVDTVGGLFVDPDHHRRGIGRALMERARGSRQVLELTVFEANSTGRRFYEAYGFELVGRRLDEASGQHELLPCLEPQ